MRYALIGCGRISHNHIAAAVNNDLEIVGLCDIDLGRAEKLANDNNITSRVFDDYKEALSETRPDFVAVATESGKHAQIALDCINAGVSVLIEKPISLSIKDVADIIAAAKIHGVTVGVCHQNRFNKAVQKLKSAVDEGRFGKIYNIAAVVRWNRGKDYYDQAKWRGTWEQDGGCLMNQCIHNIDLLRWIGGEIDTVYGTTSNFCHTYIEAEDFGAAIVKFKSGAVGTIEGTVNVYPKNLEETLTVFGEKGTVKLGGKSVNSIEVWEFADGKDDVESIQCEFSENPPNVYGFGHTPLYADFIDAVTNDREPYVTTQDGKNALDVVLAIYTTASSKSKITFPLMECSTLNFK